MKSLALFSMISVMLAMTIPTKLSDSEWKVLKSFTEDVKTQAIGWARSDRFTPEILDISRINMAKTRNIDLGHLEHPNIAGPYEKWKKKFFQELQSTNLHAGGVNGEGSVQPFD